MKKIFLYLIVSLFFINVNLSRVYGFNLESEEDINELRKKIFGGLDVSLSGVGRIEGTLENKFGELTNIGGRNTSAATDETFYDFRSYLTTKIKKEQVSLVISVDIAGDDFSDPAGAILGNGLDNTSVTTNGAGPAVVRDDNWNLRIRHLYLNYNGFVNFTAGRQPAKVGHGIMVNTIRDAAKLVKSFKIFTIGGVLVKGAETFPNIIESSDSLGENDNDLDAYLVFGKYKRENFVATLSYVIQDETRNDRKWPEKQFVNLSADGSFGNFDYQLEGIYYGGKTPANAAGVRRDNKGWLGYGNLQYKLPAFHSRVGGAIGYGSGDNDAGDNTQSNYESLFMNNNGFKIANIYGNDIHGYDSFRPDTASADGNNAGAGFANTTFFQLTAFNQPTDRLDVEGVFTYFRASKSQLVGEGVLLHANDGTVAAGETERSSDIGWETDLNLHYKISDGFSFYTRFGYFSPGKIWGRSVPDAKKAQGGFLFNF